MYELGRLHLTLGGPDALSLALPHLERAAAADPRDEPAHALLLTVTVALCNSTDAALNAVETAWAFRERFPWSYQIAAGLVSALVKSGRGREALTISEEIIPLEGDGAQNRSEVFPALGETIPSIHLLRGDAFRYLE
jgi:hypothetical protein